MLYTCEVMISWVTVCNHAWHIVAIGVTIQFCGWVTATHMYIRILCTRMYICVCIMLVLHLKQRGHRLEHIIYCICIGIIYC